MKNVTIVASIYFSNVKAYGYQHFVTHVLNTRNKTRERILIYHCVVETRVETHGLRN